MNNRDGRAIIAIDLLRFACAMLVVAHHYGAAFARAPSQAGAALLSRLAVGDGSKWSWFGWVGVELFFVISGLVIAISAEGASVSDFVRRRVLRLVPAAWLCASMSFLVLSVAVARPGLASSWLVSMTFWPNGIQIDPSYWTLGIEIFFYLLIATVLGGAGDPSRIARRGIMLGWWSSAFWLFAALSGWMWTPLIDYRPVQLMLLDHGCFFALGVLAWGVLRDGMTRHRLVPFGVFLAAGLAEIAARSTERAHALGIVAGPWLPILVFLLGLGVVLSAARWQPWLAAHVSARLAATLGLMTYPLYLLHQEIGAVVIASAMRAGAVYWSAATLALTIVLAAAWAVAAVLEPALRAPLARALGGRRRAAAGAGSAAGSPLPAPATRSAG